MSRKKDSLRDLLPLDIRRKILLELPYEKLLVACKSSEDIERVCSTDRFWEEYVEYNYGIPKTSYSKNTAKNVAEAIYDFLQNIFSSGKIVSIENLKLFIEESDGEDLDQYFEDEINNDLRRPAFFYLDLQSPPSFIMNDDVYLEDLTDLADKTIYNPDTPQESAFVENLTNIFTRESPFLTPEGIRYYKFEPAAKSYRYVINSRRRRAPDEGFYLPGQLATDITGNIYDYGHILYFSQVYPTMKKYIV